jgi:hypothetical protein
MPESEAPLGRCGPRHRHDGRVAAAFGFCRRKWDWRRACTGSWYPPQPASEASVMASSCPETAPSLIAHTGKHVATTSRLQRACARSGEFRWTRFVPSNWRGRGNGPGKRAPARGGDVRRSRAAAGDVVRPSSYRAVRPMLDQAAGLRLVQLWLGTGAELTHQDGYGTPLARVDTWRMRLAGQLLLRSTGARHTHRVSLVVESGRYP